MGYPYYFFVALPLLNSYWHKFLIVLFKPFFMSINLNDPGRNRTSDQGAGNDPALRDDSAAQPGISTVSDSDTDYLNEETVSVSNDPDTSDFDDDLTEEDFDVDEEGDDDDIV
jgi:hypothetical protein